jgi:hypothetical protein
MLHTPGGEIVLNGDVCGVVHREQFSSSTYLRNSVSGTDRDTSLFPCAHPPNGCDAGYYGANLQPDAEWIAQIAENSAI